MRGECLADEEREGGRGKREEKGELGIMKRRRGEREGEKGEKRLVILFKFLRGERRERRDEKGGDKEGK